MALEKKEFKDKRKLNFDKLQKTLKKKNNTITYKQYDDFKQQQQSKKQDDNISKKSFASEIKCNFMNYQKTDINEPENIFYFKRAGDPQVNYFNKNKNMNIFQNHISSKSYNNIDCNKDQSTVQSRSCINEKDQNVVKNFKIKKFSEFFDKVQQKEQKEQIIKKKDSNFLKNQRNSYLDQHCCKSLIKSIKQYNQKQNKVSFDSNIDKQEKRFDKISNYDRVNQKIQQFDTKSKKSQKPINDEIELLNEQKFNDEASQQQEQNDSQEQENSQIQEEQIDEQKSLRHQLSDDMTVLSLNSKINEDFDYKLIPNYIAKNKLKPRYSINYTTAYMSQFHKEPHKKDVFNNQTVQKQVNAEMNQTFKKLNEYTISEIDVPYSNYPIKTTNQYFYPHHDVQDQQFHFKFTQKKPYHKGMQSNTSNRFQYLIPENQKEAMGPNCPQFQEIMEQRVLHDLKFQHQTNYENDYVPKKNNPITNKPMPPVPQETIFPHKKDSMFYHMIQKDRTKPTNKQIANSMMAL